MSGITPRNYKTQLIGGCGRGGLELEEGAPKVLCQMTRGTMHLEVSTARGGAEGKGMACWPVRGSGCRPGRGNGLKASS